MANRFQNTLSDLQACYEHIDDHEVFDNPEENTARDRLIKQCVKIALDYGYEVGHEVQEVELGEQQ